MGAGGKSDLLWWGSLGLGARKPGRRLEGSVQEVRVSGGVYNISSNI